MPKRLLFILLFSGCYFLSFAQEAKKSGIIKGKLINKVTKTPFNDVRITIPSQNTFTTSEGEGEFSLSEVPYGSQQVIIGGGNAKRDTLTVNVTKNITDLGDILVTPTEQSGIGNGEIPTIAMEENTSQDDENASSASASSSGFYVSNHDDFLRTASITFGSYRFRPRGYDNADVQINGVPIQDLETGFSSIGQVGGLNDVLRDRTITYGLTPSDYSYGTIKGSTYIHATAADQRQGTTVSYFASNWSFRNRVMLTHSTGVMKNGWAFSASASRRWTKESYIPGTFYDGSSFYAAASKLTKHGQFNLTAMGAPTRRGKATSETDEAFSLANNHYYNSAWGYQNGEKRNAHVSDVFQPVIIANYTYRAGEKTRWNTALGYEFGKNKNSSIDYYNGYTPNADYYRNMPSYYLNGNTPNPVAADAVTAQFSAHPEQLQIDWANLYNQNYTNTETIHNVNGIAGNNVTGKRSIYVLSNNVDDMKKIIFNTNVERYINENITAMGGIQVINQKDEYYKEVADLMGGDFFVNLNQFAVQQTIGTPTYNQNNINNPNALIKVGDRYGKDYILNVTKSTAWGQGTFKYNKFDFFAAIEGGMTSFNRDGLMKNGLFPDNSYGKSATHSFGTYKVKAGATYKLDVKNIIYLNAGYSTDAPKVDYTYISGAGRDIIIDNPTVMKTKTVELGYIKRTPILSLRLSGYVTDITDNTVIKRFFNDDPSFLTFVNYVMQGVNTRSIGAEFAATYKLTKELSVTGVAAKGQAFYTDRPVVTVYQDNDPTLKVASRKVYIKNYYLGVGPQSIYSIAFNYRLRSNWNANINFNYMDDNYVEINPDRRTQLAADLVTPGSNQWNKIYNQEKLPSAFTVDIHGGKNFDISGLYKMLHHKTTLYFTAGIVNLLNNTNIKTTGYEQLRYDFTYHNPDKFQNKYGYAYGINFYTSLSLRF